MRGLMPVRRLKPTGGLASIGGPVFHPSGGREGVGEPHRARVGSASPVFCSDPRSRLGGCFSSVGRLQLVGTGRVDLAPFSAARAPSAVFRTHDSACRSARPPVELIDTNTAATGCGDRPLLSWPSASRQGVARLCDHRAAARRARRSAFSFWFHLTGACTGDPQSLDEDRGAREGVATICLLARVARERFDQTERPRLRRIRGSLRLSACPPDRVDRGGARPGPSDSAREPSE